MIALREVTDWLPAYNHTYLFDGSAAVAYIKSGDTQPIYFKKPLKIDKRGRKFVELKVNPFKHIASKAAESRKWRVESLSKGSIYVVQLTGEDWSCNCAGFTYRKTCKHVTEVYKKYGNE